MGWSIGFDEHWSRDIGYGVPAICDHPDCSVEIDRGLAYVCGGEPFGGDHGCGLYFCDEHLFYGLVDPAVHQRCERCIENEPPFEAKPDVPAWTRHKNLDSSWAEWRAANSIPEPSKADQQAYVLEQEGDLDNDDDDDETEIAADSLGA